MDEYMPEKKILIVDDEEDNLSILTEILEDRGLTAVGFNNAQDALVELSKNHYPVVLTDLNMPVMDGKKFIYELTIKEFIPVIVVQTAINNVKSVIELMQLGVYDYIIKPFGREELIHRVEKAFEIAEFRELKLQIEREKEETIKEELDWNAYKKKYISKEEDRMDKVKLSSIHSNLVQSAGLGTLYSILGMIKKSSKQEDNFFKVNADLYNVLMSNYSVLANMVSTFQDMDFVLSSNLNYQPIKLVDLLEFLKKVTETEKHYADLKNQKIKLGEFKGPYLEKVLQIDLKFMEKVFKELLYNAFKFSIANSNIFILIETHKDKVILSFMNTPVPDDSGYSGIREEYYKMIFEPFFRISKYFFEDYPTLDFGLGLALADKIIRKHSGSITVTNLNNYIDKKGDKIVNFKVELNYQ